MEPALIDTNIVSMSLRGHPEVRDRFAAYVEEHGKVSFSMITVPGLGTPGHRGV